MQEVFKGGCAVFGKEFLEPHKILCTNGAFFTPDGRVTVERDVRVEKERVRSPDNLSERVAEITDFVAAYTLLYSRIEILIQILSSDVFDIKK